MISARNEIFFCQQTQNEECETANRILVLGGRFYPVTNSRFAFTFPDKKLLSRPAHSSSHSSSHPPSSILQPLIPSILIDVEALLDSMECVDCFSGILEVLEKIVEKYPNEFCERFQVCKRLLDVGKITSDEQSFCLDECY